MKPSATEVLAVVRMVRAAADEIEALRLMALFVERVEGETGADFDRSQANASTEEERRRLWPAHARLLQGNEKAWNEQRWDLVGEEGKAWLAEVEQTSKVSRGTEEK